LLMYNALVYRQQHVVAQDFGGVEQEFHAILASNDSLTSSSAWIAMSRVTVGN
jgi:hypothetical protein